MNTPLLPILVTYHLNTASWNHEVSTEANSQRIFLVPEHLATEQYIQSCEFQNRAIYEIASKNFKDEESNRFFVLDGTDRESINVMVFNEAYKNELDDPELLTQENLLNNGTFSFYEECKDDQGLVQITISIELSNALLINQEQVNFLGSILTPYTELDLTPFYAFEVGNEETF